MADLLGDGNIKVSFVPTIANKNAPTTTELNAGTALESLITPDGLDITPSTAEVDLSALNSTFDAGGAGRRKYAVMLTLKRQTGTDTVFTSVLTYQASGYLVVRRNLVATTAWTAAQTCEVYPVQCGEPGPLKPAPNEVQKYQVPMFNTSDAVRVATIA